MAGLPIQGFSQKVEYYRSGYPRYAALLATHPAFQNFRRFTRTRMRLLLLKQDEITTLEENLDQIDVAENCDIYLGCSRIDRNTARKDVLQKLKTALREYDEMIEQNHRALSFPEADHRDIDSLKNWVEGHCSIARAETAYLDKYWDHFNFTGARDHAVTRIEARIEDGAAWLKFILQKHMPSLSTKGDSPITDDENIFFLSENMRRFCRVLTTWVASVILLVPVIILYNISNPKGRLVTIILTTGLFLSILSSFTRARTIEIVATGASYAAVLVVFTSANNGMIQNGNCGSPC